MKFRNQIAFLSLTIVAVSIFFAVSTPKSCDTPLAASDLSTLETIAHNAMKERPTELNFLGLEADSSNLVLSNSRATSRELIIDQPVDHPMDLATLYLYTEINGYNYMFSFDNCGNLLDIANISGFDIGIISKEAS